MITLDAIAAGADLGSLSRDERVSLLLRLAAAQTRLAVAMGNDKGTTVDSQALELIDAVEMARRIHVPTSWIRSEQRAKRLPHIQVGRYVRFDPIAVAAALEARRS